MTGPQIPAFSPLLFAPNYRCLSALQRRRPSASPPSAPIVTVFPLHLTKFANNLLDFLSQNSHRIHFLEELQRLLLQFSEEWRGGGGVLHEFSCRNTWTPIIVEIGTFLLQINNVVYANYCIISTNVIQSHHPQSHRLLVSSSESSARCDSTAPCRSASSFLTVSI